MNFALEIFNLILILSASVLCIFLIIYFNRITRSIKEIEREVKDISNQLEPLIESYTGLSEKLSELVGDAEEQINIVKNTISRVKEKIDLLLSVEEKIRGGIENPIGNLIRNLAAVKKGIEVFYNSYLNRNK